MTGPSVILDPTTHAVRGDLADVRLAEFVFAPHYAAPMACIANRIVVLNPTRTGGDPLAELADKEQFEVLELAGTRAWGIAPERGLVGYVDRSALDPVAPVPA